jgi:serine/threonine-protein kinase
VAAKYRLVELIGEGGMGSVWRAERLPEGGEVALKLMRQDMVGERSRSRFDREAEYAASIHHRNVVEVVDHGVHDDHPYLAMELLDGQSLDRRLLELPPPSIGELLRWMSQALAGLGAVHARGIIHRDLKPANLFLVRSPRARDGACTVKVLDFGLSRSLGESTGDTPGLSLTQTHQFLGTPFYVAPEQVRSAKHIDERADLYSMGIILYEAIAGRRPFEGPSAAAVIAAVVADTPKSLAVRRPDLPAPLCEAITRAMAKSPEARFASAAEMAAALDEWGRDGGLERVLATPRVVGVEDAAGSSVGPGVSDTEPASDPLDVEPDGRRARGSRRSRSSGMHVVGLLGAFGAVGLAAALAAAWLAASPPPEPAEPTPAAAAVPVADAIYLDGVYALTPVGPLAHVAQAVRKLPTDLRDQALVIADAGGWRVVTDGPIRGERARELAEEHDLEPTPWTGEARTTWRPRVVVTTSSLNVRETPDAAGGFMQTMPRGTIAVALLGEADGVASELGGRGSWAQVTPSGATLGWSAATFLEPYAGCVPRERDLPRSASATASRVRLMRGGRGFEAVLVLDAHADRSDLALYRMTAECALQLEREIQVAGRVEDVLLPVTDESGSETLIVIAWTHPTLGRGREVWNAYVLDEAEPIWETQLRSSQRLRAGRTSIATSIRRGPNDEVGYWPLRVRHPDGRRVYYEWNGRTLATAGPGNR